MKASTIFWGVVLTCATASSAWSQSFGDIAKQEEERRKALKTAGKVYTNGDLPPVPVSPPEPRAEAADAKGVAGTEKAAIEAAPKADAKEAGPSIDQGEEHWRKLMNNARELRARSDTYLEALRIRLEALTADFYAQADPAVRSSIGAQRNRVFDDMERLRQDMADQDAAIAKIEADAAKANIPPGWIR
jgi:hypothetical protein